MIDYNPCQGCEFFNKPYWSVVSPCENCPRQATSGYITTNTTTVSTADLVEVVRCKDCKHYMTIHCTCDGCCISDDWYCADGERKADDAVN